MYNLTDIMDPEEEDGDNKKFEGDSIDYPTSKGDDNADDDDDLSEDDADDEDEEESSDSEEEHLTLTVPAPALHTTPPPSAYRVTARISVQPHIPMSFPSKSEVERLLAIPTPSLFPVLPTSYPLPPFLMPLPIFTPLPPPPPIILPRTRASMVLMRSVVPSTFILAPRSRTPPIGTPPLTLVTQIEALQRDVSTLQGQQIDDEARLMRHIQHEHAQRDAAPEDGDRPRTVRLTRECTYKDYLNCGPLKFNGTEGVIGLTRWFERTEFVSSISNCIAENQMMTAKYCPRGEVKKLEVELWNLKESDVIERYVGGLPKMIRGNIMSYEPKSMQKAIEFANDQMDQKLLGIADRQPITKGSLTILQGTNKTNNHSEGTTMLHGPMLQGLEKRNHTEEPNLYALNANSTMMEHVRATAAYQGVPTCFECGAQGHFKNNCSKLGNKNQGNRNQRNQNQAGNGNDVARAYRVGTAGGNPDANVVTGTFLLNNRYALILFDTGADKSFVSTAFSSLININPSTLDYSYDVELADGQIIR
nr:hypothetical protein [Tanacetum cinerariifolium]